MRKIFSLFAALTLSVGLWAETVAYRYPTYIDDDVTKGIDMWLTSSKDATPVTSTSSTWGAADQETWLVVSENVTISQRVTCEGDVHLILANDVTLNATQGITVSDEGNSLTIYAQTEDIAHMGQLIATGGHDDDAGIGGRIMKKGSNITINGGIVEATGGEYGAGIGGGNMGYGSYITINGGEVTATGGEYGAGIGGGHIGNGSYIVINDGEVTATGGEGTAGIGGGYDGSAVNIFVATNLIVKAGTSADPTTEIAKTRTATTDIANDLAGKQYATIEPAPAPVSTTYLDENGVEQNIDAWEVKDASTAVTWGTAGQTTWYVVTGEDVQLAKGAICNGDVHLILADGAKLTAKGKTFCVAIQVSGSNSLTIYAQSTDDQMGQLTATGAGYGAGIGGEDFSSGSNITINGGIVEATGGNYGAGIGGGNSGSGENITINGGVVTATGGYSAAGIGGGDYGSSGSNITINGGVVTANGGQFGAGIGGGRESDGSNITINGGTVKATGGDQAAGIGGGAWEGDGSNITINGGIVEATGGTYAAGIGGGDSGSGSNITINGGTVTATGGEDASAIGNGAECESSASNIYISDAYVLKAGSAANPTDIIAHSSAADLSSTLTQQYVKIEGLATPYTREMTTGNWATVCLPYAATSFEGADFYKVNYYDGDTKLYIEEVSSLVAGMPYIFHTTATTVTINHNATAPEAVTAGYEGRGLYGSFARKTIAYDAEHAFAALANNTVNVIEEGHTVTVPACRAYFDMKQVPTSEQPHSAPLRCISIPSKNPTDLGQWNKRPEGYKGQKTIKVIENGQFRIVRDGKTYNAQGQIIQ